jgi:hypothetical protein
MLRSRDLEPPVPMSNASVGSFHMYLHQYDQAIEETRRSEGSSKRPWLLIVRRQKGTPLFRTAKGKTQHTEWRILPLGQGVSAYSAGGLSHDSAPCRWCW